MQRWGAALYTPQSSQATAASTKTASAGLSKRLFSVAGALSPVPQPQPGQATDEEVVLHAPAAAPPVFKLAWMAALRCRSAPNSSSVSNDGLFGVVVSFMLQTISQISFAGQPDP